MLINFSWLKLPKEEFRILMMLADKGDYSGNFNSMFDYFKIGASQTNRNRITAALESLKKQGIIEYNRVGNMQNVKLIPTEEINYEVDKKQYVEIITHEAFSVSVDRFAVVKVWAWYLTNQNVQFTASVVSSDTTLSKSTIGLAKRVLLYDFNYIASGKVTDDENNVIGQEICFGIDFEKQ